jgi:hypothetical protein
MPKQMAPDKVCLENVLILYGIFMARLCPKRQRLGAMISIAPAFGAFHNK